MGAQLQVQAWAKPVLGQVCCCGDAKTKVRTRWLGREAILHRANLKNIMGQSQERLDEAIQSEIKRMFDDADIDCNENLNKSEVDAMVACLRKRGFEFPVAVESFDFDCSGSLDKKEFHTMMRVVLHERQGNLRKIIHATTEGMLAEAWTVARGNASSYISMARLAPLLHSLSQELGEPPPKEEDVMKQMRKYDADHNHQLERHEFEVLYYDFLLKLFVLPRSAMPSPGAEVAVTPEDKPLAPVVNIPYAAGPAPTSPRNKKQDGSSSRSSGRSADSVEDVRGVP